MRLRCVSESRLFIKRIVRMHGLPNHSSGIRGENAMGLFFVLNVLAYGIS